VDAYELKVHNIAGGVHLSASSSTNAALAGTVFIRPSENIEVLKTGSGDDVQIELKTVGTTIITPFDTSTNTARWEIGIHPDIPAELDLELIFGNLSVDLRGTQVSDFVVETIFGNKDITLSDLPGTEGRLSGIVGKTTLTIPENLSVKVRIDDGIVTTVYPDEFTRNGDWVYSPGAENDPDAMEFRISQLVGRVVLESENE
jgi:hypothetical protein